MFKTCLFCKVSKPTIEFGRHRNNKDGLQSYCRKCSLEYQRNYQRKLAAAKRAQASKMTVTTVPATPLSVEFTQSQFNLFQKSVIIYFFCLYVLLELLSYTFRKIIG